MEVISVQVELSSRHMLYKIWRKSGHSPEYNVFWKRKYVVDMLQLFEGMLKLDIMCLYFAQALKYFLPLMLFAIGRGSTLLF